MQSSRSALKGGSLLNSSSADDTSATSENAEGDATSDKIIIAQEKESDVGAMMFAFRSDVKRRVKKAIREKPLNNVPGAWKGGVIGYLAEAIVLPSFITAAAPASTVQREQNVSGGARERDWNS
jgi:hypothetical protein